MRNLGDSWNAGPVPTHLPPRPDVIAPAARNHSVRETFETAPGWKRVGAILGIIAGFFVLLTIPGWLGIGRYRRWKRGETPTPHVLIAWGYIWWGFWLVVFTSALLSPS